MEPEMRPTSKPLTKQQLAKEQFNAAQTLAFKNLTSQEVRAMVQGGANISLKGLHTGDADAKEVVEYYVMLQKFFDEKKKFDNRYCAKVTDASNEPEWAPKMKSKIKD